MLKRPAFTLLVAVLLAAAFLYGIMQLFSLGYRAGHVYPPYSSLRADPLGTKVLYEALAELPGVAVRRNFRALPRLGIEQPVTLLYAGVARRVFWEPNELTALESRVSGGARAVFAFAPAERQPVGPDARSTRKEKAAPADAGNEGKAGPESGDEEDRSMLSFDEVAKRWGVAFDYLPAANEKAFARKATAAAGEASLRKEIPWHSALHFDKLGPEWTTLYTSDGKPVVAERKFGAGSILLAGDAYFLSNEALRRDRESALLGRVFSGPPTVVFDEEHLGVREQPGIANLAGKYRLHGAIATLVLLAALFVWKNAVPFLPPREDPAAGGVVMGKESAEGFVNLLRRTIRPSELLEVCVEEWRKTSPESAGDRARLEAAWAAERSRPAKARNVVAAYRTISQSLTRKS